MEVVAVGWAVAEEERQKAWWIGQSGENDKRRSGSEGWTIHIQSDLSIMDLAITETLLYRTRSSANLTLLWETNLNFGRLAITETLFYRSAILVARSDCIAAR